MNIFEKIQAYIWKRWYMAAFAKDRESQSGIALIIAIVSVSMIMIFSSNLIINSQVRLELAIANRDNLVAEYMAKSGFNLAVFLLSADFGYDLAMESGQLGQKIEATDSKSDIWAMMNDLPIGGETAELMAAAQDQFELSSVSDDKVLGTLKLFSGQFILDVSDESSKININKCVVDGRCKEQAMLTQLFSCPAEAEFLNLKGLVPEEMSERIKDWVDSDTKTVNSGFSSENDPYSKYEPSYQAKNGPIDSVSELKLIEGWDDEMHTVFSPYITGYPYIGKKDDPSLININTAGKSLLTCLFASSRNLCLEGMEQFLSENEGGMIASTAKEIPRILKDSLCVSDDKIASWFGVRSHAFRIRVQGIADRQEKSIDAVVGRVVPNIAKKKNNSYEILYWSMK